MIEGLKALPWMQEAESRGVLGIPSSCENCMQANGEQTRQTWGCAYAPPPPVALRPYVTVPAPLDAPQGTTCPGYTTRLPEVIEVSRARLHWSKGAIMAFCRGQPRFALLAGIEILEGATNDRDRWAMNNPVKKGG